MGYKCEAFQNIPVVLLRASFAKVARVRFRFRTLQSSKISVCVPTGSFGLIALTRHHRVKNTATRRIRHRGTNITWISYWITGKGDVGLVLKNGPILEVKLMQRFKRKRPIRPHRPNRPSKPHGEPNRPKAARLSEIQLADQLNQRWPKALVSIGIKQNALLSKTDPLCCFSFLTPMLTAIVFVARAPQASNVKTRVPAGAFENSAALWNLKCKAHREDTNQTPT